MYGRNDTLTDEAFNPGLCIGPRAAMSVLSLGRLAASVFLLRSTSGLDYYLHYTDRQAIAKNDFAANSMAPAKRKVGRAPSGGSKVQRGHFRILPEPTD